jgi:hypothetical protein
VADSTSDHLHDGDLLFGQSEKLDDVAVDLPIVSIWR